MTGAERTYYDRRAAEYDDFYLGTGLFATRNRPGWPEELATLKGVLASLRFSSVLDVACGTGFLTEHLHGVAAALDQSASMLALARHRLPHTPLVQGDALRLPFPPNRFECLASCHFYGHLDASSARAFISEARRVSKSLLMVDAAKREDVPEEEHQQRVLNDGSRHVVFKRYFTPEQLISEIGPARVLHSGRWFVALLA